MTTAEIITLALTQYVNVGADSAATDINLRQRGEVRLNSRSSDAWALAPWWFRQSSGVVTIASGASSGVCPPDFDGRFGTQGGVFLDNNQAQPPPRYMAPAQLFMLRQQVQQTSSYPWFYCLSGRDPATSLPLLQVYPTASSGYTLNLANYVASPPRLIDKPTAPAVALGAPSVLSPGVYTYVLTFLTASGETEAGIPSLPITVTALGEEIVLTDIPTSIQHSCVGRGLYRTTANGTVYGLVIDIPDNTTTTYTDILADAFLGPPPPDVVTAVTGTEVYPTDFHDGILLDGLIQELATTQGDLRDNKWRDEWKSEVKQRWGEYKQGQNQTRVMPRYGICNGYGSTLRGFWRPIGS